MDSHNASFEPMDIDLSATSVKAMDISFNDSGDVMYEQTILTPPPTEESHHSTEKINSSLSSPPAVKKYHITIQKPSNNYKNKVWKIFAAILVAFTSLITYHLYALKCCDNFDIKTLSVILKNSLYGQTEAVNMIVRTLELEESHKILFFSGGTGVGKTYASSLILQSLGTCSNTYHYMMPISANALSTEYMFGLTMCQRALLVVDDLSVSDMHIKSQIKSVIEKSENLSKDIVVILIFNCYNSKDFDNQCDNYFNTQLLHNFADVKALKRIVKFEPLNENHLKKCINQELGDKTLDEVRLTEILKNFNVTTDGCKGVHSKMKYINVV